MLPGCIVGFVLRPARMLSCLWALVYCTTEHCRVTLLERGSGQYINVDNSILAHMD